MNSLLTATVPLFPHLQKAARRECDAVAAASLEHVGKQYRLTRELVPGAIDCSTVVSQAHWTGAAIQTPFIAEAQRLATNAVVVDVADLLPGDAIFAFPDKYRSPRGQHNHVVLFLGQDEHGRSWAMESRPEAGAALRPLTEVVFDGGIRRFCIEPLRVFPAGDWSALARRVPKLGRLGARLTADYNRYGRHRGTDLYMDSGWATIAPLTGTIVDVQRLAGAIFVGIWSPGTTLYTVLGPLAASPGIRAGKEVQRGERLGTVVDRPASGAGMCNAIPQAKGVRLHWELWGPPEFGVTPAPQVSAHQLPRPVRQERQLIPHNVVYAVKRGQIGSCVPRRWCENAAPL